MFVQSKDRAKELFQELIYDGINVDVIHADRTQTQVLYTTTVYCILLYTSAVIYYLSDGFFVEHILSEG